MTRTPPSPPSSPSTARAPERVAYAGDDLLDLPVIRRCGLSFAPADAAPEVRQRVHRVLDGSRRPGRGARDVRAGPPRPRPLGSARRPSPRRLVGLVRCLAARRAACRPGSSRPCSNAGLWLLSSTLGRLPWRAAQRAGPGDRRPRLDALPARPPPRPRSPRPRLSRHSRGGAPPDRPRLLPPFRRDAGRVPPPLPSRLRFRGLRRRGPGVGGDREGAARGAPADDRHRPLRQLGAARRGDQLRRRRHGRRRPPARRAPAAAAARRPARALRHPHDRARRRGGRPPAPEHAAAGRRARAC